MKIPMKLVYQYMAIFFNFSLTSNHFHSLQIENCDSNSRLVVDEDDYAKLRLERVEVTDTPFYIQGYDIRCRPIRPYVLSSELSGAYVKTTVEIWIMGKICCILYHRHVSLHVHVIDLCINIITCDSVARLKLNTIIV